VIAHLAPAQAPLPWPLAFPLPAADVSTLAAITHAHPQRSLLAAPHHRGLRGHL
jgi:hypothetical protein